METSNFGLGSALSDGTNLSGGFGSPISSGLQLQQRNVILEAQQEEKKRLREQQLQERMMRYTSFDTGKFNNATRAKEFQTKVAQTMPKVFEATQKGDIMEASRLKQELQNELAIAKIVDKEEYELGKLDKRLATTKQAQEAYNRGGAAELAKENEKYWFSPIADIDEETGSFKVRQIADPKIDKRIAKDIDDRLSEMFPDKKVGSAGGVNYYQIDKNTPAYKQAKQEVINKYLGDEEITDQVLATKGFKKYYDEYLDRNKVERGLDDELDVADALKQYIGVKYDENEKLKVKGIAQKSSGGGSGKKTNWIYTEPDANGFVAVELKNNPTPKQILSGSIVQGDGKKTSVNKTITSPKIKYLGGESFSVIGFDDKNDDKTIELVDVSASDIMNKFEFTPEEMKAKFGYVKKGVNAAPKAVITKKKKLY
jgi:hypothetical protein